MSVKILTDIKIDQCATWRKETDYIFCSDIGVSIFNNKKGLVKRLMRLLIQCKNYDIVITADLKTAQLFGLIRSVFRLSKVKHIVLELMLDEPGDSFVWKIKTMFQRVCFSSTDIVFVSARSEIKTYSKRLKVPESRIRFLPFHTNVIEPRIVAGTGGYIFSAGKSGRDYATFADAVDGLNANFVVVSDRYSINGVNFPENVAVYVDVSYERYLELLYGCSMVVVPLKKLVKSTGQVVFLEAMALGKPVIATDTIGTADYIDHGITGMLTPPEDTVALRAAISDFIDNPTVYSSMALQAFNKVVRSHTFEAYVNTILATANELISKDFS